MISRKPNEKNFEKQNKAAEIVCKMLIIFRKKAVLCQNRLTQFNENIALK